MLETLRVVFGLETAVVSYPSTAYFTGDVEKALERSDPLDSDRIFLIKSFDADFSFFC